jgi:hypothetical protein
VFLLLKHILLDDDQFRGIDIYTKIKVINKHNRKSVLLADVYMSCIFVLPADVYLSCTYVLSADVYLSCICVLPADVYLSCIYVLPAGVYLSCYTLWLENHRNGDKFDTFNTFIHDKYTSAGNTHIHDKYTSTGNTHIHDKCLACESWYCWFILLWYRWVFDLNC